MKTTLTTKLIIALISVMLVPLLFITFVFTVDLNKAFKHFTLNMEIVQQQTYQESRRIIEKLTQNEVKESGRHIAREIENYIAQHPKLTMKQLQATPEFQRLALQPVGKNGYTAIHEIPGGINRFHLDGQYVNTDLRFLSSELPDFARLYEEHLGNGGREVEGFCLWKEPNGIMKKYFMYMRPLQVRTRDKLQLGLMVTSSVADEVPVLSAINNRTQQILAQTKKGTRQLLKTFYVRYIFILLVLIIIAIGFTLLFIKQTVKPARQLIKDMNNFALGDKNVQVAIKSTDEIGQLADSFNNLITMILDEEEKTKEIYLAIIATLAKALEAKDAYTRGHTQRVTEYAVKIAHFLNLPQSVIETIHKAALIHDIGKIGIKSEILDKKDPLNEDEWKIIKTHPIMGIDILRPVKILGDMLPIIRYHHERFDGSGYPEGLRASDIPLGARILAVADSFDAMTSDRPYHLRLSVAEAILELKNNSGTQFDTEVVKALLALLAQEENKNI